MNTAISPAEAGIVNHAVVSMDRWVAQRKALLAKEKELTHLRDQLASERRAMPWVRIDKHYVFDTPPGPRPLAELFEGRRQLLVQHFMFGPGWEQGCPSCSFMADHSDGMNIHLAHRDVTLVAISRAPLAGAPTTCSTSHPRGVTSGMCSMEWVRHHDRYEPEPAAKATAAAAGGCCHANV